MILRTYMCEQCAHRIEVELRSDQWDQPPPECPACVDRGMVQDFKPPGIGGSARARATKLAEDIVSTDYNVADFKAEGRPEGRAQVRYKDVQAGGTSSWGMHSEALSQAVTLGRQTRLQHGSGLDIIKSMPDLIQASKQRSIKVW